MDAVTNMVRSELIHQTARELATTPWGARGEVVRRTAAVLNLSKQRTHALLRDAGRALAVLPTRQRRADAGQTAMSEDELETIAGAIKETFRAGKQMLSLEAALDMLYAAGKLQTRLSADRVSELLRQRGKHPDQLNRPSPSVQMRTEHPNAVWQIDASVCVLYRTPKGETVMMDVAGEVYKNKLHNFTKVMNDLLVRYVGTDHTSGAIGVRLYTGGETTENALDFLMWLMTQRQGADGAPMPFYGAPLCLYTDQGSAFKSGPFTAFCRAMDIKLIHHAPRNSRATGQVENAQNLVERGMESRLRFLDPATLTMERLNSLSELWMHAFNATRKHDRHGMTRYGAWQLIEAHQLRIVPELEVMRALPASVAEPRTVTGDMKVSFAIKGQGSNDYDLRYVPGLSVGDKVYVTVNPYEMPAVRVGVTDRETGEIAWHQVEPVQKDRFGFDTSSPVLSKTYRAMPNTPADEARNAITRQAYATADGPATLEEARQAQRDKRAPFLGQFDPLADIKAAQVPAYLPKRGTALDAQAPTVDAVRLSVAEACKRLKARLGERYDQGTYAWLTERYGSAGVPEDVVNGMGAQAQADQQPAGVAQLRVAAGGL
jgi:transposase InsO family protein